jgi:O-antigen/teichoic acid export membrane protein
VTALFEPAARHGLRPSLERLRHSRLVRQNLVLFIGGLVAGIGGFVYHAVAGRVLGPKAYGEVASLVALFTVGTTVTLILILVIARYAAHLDAEGRPGAIKHVVMRTCRLLIAPGVAVSLLGLALAVPAAAFLNLASPVPVIWLGVAMAVYWYVAVPRGVLQGTQRFPSLALNLSGEVIARTGFLALLLFLGLGVTGAVIALLMGALLALGLGGFSIRDYLQLEPETVRMRTLVSFALTATAGTVGIILLYNLDVVLAKHFLPAHQAGIYAGLNKIGTILYFLTLSVSQVLFPRVVEAVATGRHPVRLLVLSGAIMSLLGVCALAVFAVAPGLVVRVLYGGAFIDAVPYVFWVGCIGLALSLDNLLVQFFMAVHDRAFIPILAGACLLLLSLITLFHGGIGQVVANVLATVVLLLVALLFRLLFLLPQLRPEMVAEEAA